MMTTGLDLKEKLDRITERDEVLNRTRNEVIQCMEEALESAYERIKVLNRTRNEVITERDALQEKLDRIRIDLDRLANAPE